MVYDPIYLQHDTGEHPENAGRLSAIVSHLEQTGLIEQLAPIEPRPATLEELSLVHHESHIRHIQEVAQSGGGWLDMDTVMSAGSYRAALDAVGGAIEATRAVIEGEVSSAFALLRPPGHHAIPGRAMGFCLFNNIAIAARYALSRHKLERILIVDFDVHHGNGTQEAFNENPQVGYISVHQYPHYPGTGRIDEMGSGAARGTKVNVPLPGGSGDDEYRQVFARVITPATERFRPQLILVSAGYDAHLADQLATMQVSVAGFAQMTETLKELADKLCEGRLVFCLEGGYDLKALANSVKASFDILLGEAGAVAPPGETRYRRAAPDINPLIEAIRKTHCLS
jgi:acetoin utilization deacetylase AcuC-like enzyme